MVLSVGDHWELNRLINLAEGAEILVLSEFTKPADLPAIIAERLGANRQKKKA